ncbi:MAG TPA: hypothetical protein VIL20_08825 [Sandaracinaceae bacterium]
MKRFVLAWILTCGACGGPSAPAPDEVSESWTAGDDEPLERAAEAPARRAPPTSAAAPAP